MDADSFNYEQAFERNTGWLTESEQQKLRASCVAIAGLGGAGGYQAQALVRLGVGQFKIADADTFELTNFNRQLGATVETLGRSKVEVVREMILAINPGAQVESYPQGINGQNIDTFLQSADLVIDAIDFFEQDSKLLLFRKSYEKHLVALTCCPLGFGASLIVFSPDGMKYEDYFGFREGMDEKEIRLTSTFGLSPSPLCLKYMDPKAFSLASKRAASVCPALMLVGAITATEAVKILLGKYRVHYCPTVYQIDLLTQQVSRKYFQWGMKSPWLRLKRWLLQQLTKV
ncbi:MAG: ThiF family adenylyltransferase [Candidatus Omnitrophica bacterium]|nr:ThiF family adenylyltransferase [Candidatus Omnitrophota bacterium]